MTPFMKSVHKLIAERRKRVHKLCMKARLDRDRIPRGNRERKSSDH